MIEPDDRTRVSRADLIDARPAETPTHGWPIGNGRMGTLVWTSQHALHFQLNRVDVFAVNKDAAGAHHPGPTDYGGGCAQLTISTSGDPWRDSPAYQRRLSLYDACCTITGEGVSAVCWIAADADVLVVELRDERDRPEPVEVTLSMWRPPEVRHGEHLAVYAIRETPGGMAVVQTFREGSHYCSSAVAVRAPEEHAVSETECSRALLFPAARGTRRFLIAGAACRDEQQDAGRNATAILDAAADSLTAPAVEHERWWRDFWARTHIEISSPDGRGEQAANLRTLFLYHMASSSRGAYPPKWNGSIFITGGDERNWGSQYWVWTTEMLYFPLLAADAIELGDPFFDMYLRHLPATEKAARQRWNAGGAFYPETVPFDGPVVLPEAPAAEYRAFMLEGRTEDGISEALAACCRFEHHLSTVFLDVGPVRQYCWISHLVSSGAELAIHAWWRYRYTGDIAWLRSHAYPLLRGVAEFYRTFARMGDDGRYHIHGANVHEDFWGVTDGIMDLAAIRGTLPLAICAAEMLDTDTELRASWQAFLERLAPYPMGGDPRANALTGGALADDAWAAGLRGAVDGSHNLEDVWLTPIFPFEDWTLETRDPRLDAVARRVMALAPRHRRVMEGDLLSTAIRSPIAAARAGCGEELPDILEKYAAAFAPLPNGFSLFEESTADQQAHSIEHLGLLAMTLQEALLQSVSPRPGEPEVISVFPAWPRAWDASFRLLARGGFLVAAVKRRGEVESIELESRLGETCRLRNPWSAPCLLCEDGAAPIEITNEILIFATKPGGCYRVLPAR